MNTAPIIVEQTFARSVPEVWSAITQHDLMIQWYFENIPAFEPIVGFETQFDVQSDSRVFKHQWKVKDVIPNKRIAITWTFADLPGDGLVIYELFEEGDQTRLRLTNEGLHTFPQDFPEFTRESCTGGWNYFIRDRLKAFLD